MSVRLHNDTVRAQFALQARPFTEARHANDPGLLGQYLRMIGAQRGDRIIDFCSGPGIVASRLGEAGFILCLDVTHEMLLEARKRAPFAALLESHAGCVPLRGSNRPRFPALRTAASGAAGLFDIAICRLSLHHVERPEEIVKEMARMVSPGGRVVISDIVTSEHVEDSAYTERIERLRDPSHTRCLTPTEFERLPAACGLIKTATESWISTLDHDEWMNRVFPPEENRPIVRHMLEDMAGSDKGGMKVVKTGNELRISRRGMIVAARAE